MATFLQVVELHGVAELPPATRVLYDVHANTASFDTESALVADSNHHDFELVTEGNHLSFELVDAPAPGALMARELALPAGEYLLRLDRVDFPPGGEAYLHTHQGPGIRVLLFGSIRNEAQDATTTTGRARPGTRPGPSRCARRASATSPGRSCAAWCCRAPCRERAPIRYVRDEDARASPSRRATRSSWTSRSS